MKSHAINDYISCVYANVRTDELFEGMWPVPRGITLNSYVVRGEKTALIDPLSGWGGGAGRAMEAAGCPKADYLVLNHIEPDHSGRLGEFRALNPAAKIVSTEKGLALVKSFHKIDGGLVAVKDGDELDLGGGRSLAFFEAPNLHWPETMVAWEGASGTLFSCDAFGSYGATGDRIFDDQFDEGEHALFEEESLRYYANIVSPFSAFVERAIGKLSALGVKCVAPGHGIVWRRDPGRIISRYAKYASWAGGGAEKEIAVIWGSMYGNTKAGLDAVARGIERGGARFTAHRVPDDGLSHALAAAYRSSGIVIAMPTYEYGMFPPMAHALDMFRRKHIFGKKALRVGSRGWVGGAKKEYEAAVEPLKWDSLDSVEWAGFPGAGDLALLEERGAELARRVMES